MIKEQRKNEGITLLALIITIIILVILGMSTIAIVRSDGIIQKSMSAVEKTEMAQIKEEAEMVKADIHIKAISDGKMDESTMIQKEGLLKALNEHFKDSTRNGNRVITSNEKYDIVVGNKLGIKVVKHGENTLGAGEIEITYFLPSGTNASSKRIELFFELGTDEESSATQTYWQYAQTYLDGKSEEELELLLMESNGMKTKEELYDEMIGAKSREEAEEGLADLGMTYEEALKVGWIHSYIGEISLPVLNYMKQLEGVDEIGAQQMYEASMQDPEEKAKMEAQGVTDLDSYLDLVAKEQNITREEAEEQMKAWGLFVFAFSTLAKYQNPVITLYCPDGTKKEVIELLMTESYTVRENGDYYFRAEGNKGEKGEVTIPVTGIRNNT